MTAEAFDPPTGSPPQAPNRGGPAGIGPGRRRILQAAAAAAVGLGAGALLLWPEAPPPPTPARPGDPGRSGWAAFKHAYLLPEGRVSDSGNAGVSHSEGQGYAALLAVRHDDREAFDRIHAWTKAHLPERPDGLLSWRWDPAATPAVSDRNAASDGDLLLAWALMEAGRRWQAPDLTAEAARRQQALVRAVVRPQAGLTVLLPGPEGFLTDGVAILNPSYWVFPALRALEPLAADTQQWRDLFASGLALIDRAEAQFGLVPDWISLDAAGALGWPRPESGLPAEWGYNAVRLPLYLAWAAEEPDLTRRVVAGPLSRRNGQGQWPSRVALPSGESLGWQGDRGYAALTRLVGCLEQEQAQGQSLLMAAPPRPESFSYYSAVLAALAGVAAEEHGRLACFAGPDWRDGGPVAALLP